MNNRFSKSVVIFVCVVLAGGSLLISVAAKPTKDAYPRSTATPTPTPDPIPLPERPETLSDVQTLLEETDESCQLPCFWGIRPGYTIEEEIIEFLQPVAVGNNAPELHLIFRDESGDEQIFYLGIGVNDGVVSEISVVLNKPSEWLPSQTLELSRLLSIMPSTPDVYLSINLSQRRIFLKLAYPEGILVDYAFEVRLEIGTTVDPTVDNPFLLCPSLEATELTVFRLQDGGIDALLEEYNTPQLIELNRLWTVERMTGLEVEEFVEQVIENPDECIELPSYPELTEMGYEF